MWAVMKNQRGDTLIEVLLATVVISIVIAGAFTISSRALRINQTSKERTEVVNKMRQQLELIKAAADEDAGNWNVVKSFNSDTCFYMQTDGTPIQIIPDCPTTPTVLITDADTTDFFNIWVEQSDATAGSDLARDFTVKAYWDGIGSEGFQSSSMVLRLAL